MQEKERDIGVIQLDKEVKIGAGSEELKPPRPIPPKDFSTNIHFKFTPGRTVSIIY